MRDCLCFVRILTCHRSVCTANCPGPPLRPWSFFNVGPPPPNHPTLTLAHAHTPNSFALPCFISLITLTTHTHTHRHRYYQLSRTNAQLSAQLKEAHEALFEVQTAVAATPLHKRREQTHLVSRLQDAEQVNACVGGLKLV